MLASQPVGVHEEFAADAAGLVALVAPSQAQPVTLIVMEATGAYEVPVAAPLAEAGLPHS